MSMGWAAARKLRRSIDGLGRVLAIEVHDGGARRSTCARRCSRARRPAPSRDLVRTVAEGPGSDRFLSPEIEAIVGLVQSGAVRDAAEGAVGTLR